MFVVTSTYLVSREERESLLPAHAEWLKRHHETGVFISSGSNVGRTGGAILVQGVDRMALETILANSPFSLACAARYDIVEMGSPSDSQE
ncbi:MAG: YciI family protein [Formivibrio sp.]|nr:YciI family protein [Formivibrio sp.]